ncbi:MAG: sulfotransferase [Candidatus Competibacteraceae bacterium]|nr:sulfotransferase [Candidatus Competibacteraceae bacterium]
MQPLFILTCMRSFSSVVSNMLGQHPQAYGLPELNLFLADTLGEVVGRLKTHRPQGLNGLLRTVAELEYRAQTQDAVRQAREWLGQRRNWPIQQLFSFIGQRANARMLVEKSPSTALDETRLARLHRHFPDAYFLHLTRHPRTTCKSIHEIQQKTAILAERRTGTPANPESLWLRAHRNILRFTQRLRPGQTLCLQGEMLLAQPELYLPQIAEWLELRADQDAIEAMLHPERSPYACIGPPNAPFGHDPNFLYRPRFEKRAPRPARLEGPFDWPAPGADRFSRATLQIARRLGYQ